MTRTPTPLVERALWLAPLMLALASIVDLTRGELPIDFVFYDNAAKAVAAATPPYQPDDFPLIYTPGVLYLLLPLGYLSTPAAGVLLAVLLWACACWGAATWARRVGLDVAPSIAVVAALSFFPVYRGLEPLNLDILVFALLALLAPAQKARGALVEFAVGVGVGYTIAMKPHWLSVAGPLLALQRRWAAVAGLLAGAGLMLAASLAHPALWGVFVHRMTHEVDTHWTFDLWRLSPWLGAAAFVIWCGVLAIAWWRKHPEAWLLSLTAIVVWPRPAGYAFVALLPVLFYAWTRAGRWRWPLAAAFSTPLGLAMVVTITDGVVGFDVGYGPRWAALSVVYWLAAAALLVWLAARVLKMPERESSR